MGQGVATLCNAETPAVTCSFLVVSYLFPLSELYSGWQEMLAELRQLVVEVQEIAEETGWRGPDGKVSLNTKNEGMIYQGFRQKLNR